jgi:intracellular septation protein A
MAEHTDPGRGFGLKRMVVDLLAGMLFLAVFLTTGNIYLAVVLGIVFGLAQAAWMMFRKQAIDPMQWMALALVVVLGGATIVTHNPTFAVLKPSIFEGCLAAMMLRPGWTARYAPDYARDLVPPGLMLFWGYLWAAAWFALAASNLYVARAYGLKTWAVYTSFSPWVLIGGLIGLGVLVFPPVVRREARARGVDLKARRANG